MKILETIRKTKVKTVLEKRIDFTDADIVRKLNGFTISAERLDQIAKAHGFEECARCGYLSSINNTYVNAEFIIRR